MADVEESLLPSQPPANGAKALEPPQQPANGAQALVPPVSTQPTEAALLAAVPQRGLRRSRAQIGGALQSIGIESQPGTPVPQNPPPEKTKPKNRKGQIGDLLAEDDDKENDDANAGLLAKTK